ncbi:hypothetical protein WJX81_006339 [Elliptochloris bilobata]|uniref:J domain-containing protein n=1 Tax=Elliptochloris bilobata TaxID=381761 RepID=A0AAW1S926_9CHLO
MPYPKATDLAWRGASCTTAGARCFASGAHSTALTHFELLGVPHQTFSLDSAELEQKYRALQFRLHPDKAASGSKEAQKDSAEQSTLVNQAYAVLKSPLKRALYLLELRGALNDLGGEHTVEDMELLQRVMEALAEAFKRDDLVEAATLAKQLRYITRIGEAIRDKS